MSYHTIVADPPWWHSGGGHCKRGADRHYPLLKTPQIIEAMLRSPLWLPAENSHLYLWVTNNFLPDGLHVMEALGYRYVTNVVWVKQCFGLGHYFRGQHEIALFGVRGRLTTAARDLPSVIHAKRTVHSKKPDEFFELVERASPPPRLEMFARTPRPGWDAWGNDPAIAGEGGDE